MAGLINVVEGVEKFVLGGPLAGNELDIVHQQQIHAPVAGVEVIHRALLDGLDHLDGELIALHIGDLHPGGLGADVLADGQQQMGLAQARVAVDEEGIVIFPRLFRHGQSRRVGKLIGFSHDEAVEGVALHLRQVIVRTLGGHVVRQFLLCQHQKVKFGGKQVGQDLLYDLAVAVLDDVPLEVGLGADHQAGIFDLHRATVGKPGLDGGGRQLLGQLLQYHTPDIVQRIHAFHLFTMLKKHRLSNHIIIAESAPQCKGKRDELNINKVERQFGIWSVEFGIICRRGDSRIARPGPSLTIFNSELRIPHSELS